MNLIKKCLNRVFVEGLSGMALGLFATLIIGTIIQQIGTLAGGSIGTLIYAVGKMAAGLTCAGIGVGVAYKFQESPKRDKFSNHQKFSFTFIFFIY